MVGAKESYEYVVDLLEGIKELPRVKALGVKKVMDEAKMSHCIIVELCHEVETWHAAEWKSKKLEAEGLMVTFDDKFQLLLDYGRALVAIKAKRKAQGVITKRSNSRQINTIATNMMNGGVPEKLAEYFASALHSRDVDQRYMDCQVGGGGSSAGFAHEFTAVSNFDTPHVFSTCPRVAAKIESPLTT